MQFAVVARNKRTKQSLISKLKSRGHTISRKPEFVIVAGGDGTILYSEKKFPEIPKAVLRDNSVCNKCYSEAIHFTHVLKKIESGDYKLKEEKKLEIHYGKKVFRALNEVQIRNKYPTEAIRFVVKAGKKKFVDIGDGVILSTPHGSTGYYYSATGDSFDHGIGIAFNNSHNRAKNVVVGEALEIEFLLHRGDALLCADNDSNSITRVAVGKKVIVKKSAGVARFLY